jgi:parvulin-like peptidyl-prolyl isomerase
VWRRFASFDLDFGRNTLATRSSRFRSGLICLGVILLTTLTGCDALLESTPTASPVAGGAPATILPPEQMPTAAPLWTATPAPAAGQPTAGAPSGPLAPDVVAMVGGVPISRESFDRQLNQAQVYLLQQPNLDVTTEEGRQALEQLRAQVLNWMVDQQIIQQAAAAQGVTVSQGAIDGQIQRMRGTDAQRFDAWLSANGMTLASLQDQVRLDLLTAAMRDRVTAGVARNTPHLHVRHILISERGVAEDVLRQLRAGANFIALAKKYSEDQSTRNAGGDLGFMPSGVMPPRFEQAAFALQPGQISDIIESPAGFQIIQLVEIDPTHLVSDDYWPLVQQRAFEEWMNQQRSAANVVLGQP